MKAYDIIKDFLDAFIIICVLLCLLSIGHKVDKLEQNLEEMRYELQRKNTYIDTIVVNKNFVDFWSDADRQ